jgi:hypothetical protein
VYVRDADGVERDVDATRAGRHGVGVLVDGFLIEGVDLRRLGCAARGPDLVGHLVEGGEGAPGKEDVCSLACEAAGDRGADCTGAAVDRRGA